VVFEYTYSDGTTTGSLGIYSSLEAHNEDHIEEHIEDHIEEHIGDHIVDHNRLPFLDLGQIDNFTTQPYRWFRVY
jgi:hypothetical protein